MNIHEYQAKEVLKRFAVPVLRGKTATTIDEARRAAQELGGHIWVVKAQVHAGGRGKAGGVKVAKSLDEVETHAKNIIGMKLVSPQTGPEGKIVHTIYIEEGCNIAKEYYVACLVDRATSRVTMMASTEGGVEIEEVAAKHPEKIFRISIDPAIGMQAFQARQLVFKLGIPEGAVNEAVKTLMGLYKNF